MPGQYRFRKVFRTWGFCERNALHCLICKDIFRISRNGPIFFLRIPKMTLPAVASSADGMNRIFLLMLEGTESAFGVGTAANGTSATGFGIYRSPDGQDVESLKRKNQHK